MSYQAPSGTKCRGALLVLAVQAALAQSAVPPEKAAAARVALVPRAGEHALACRVEPILPSLLYTAPEVAAGFTYSLPRAPSANSRPEETGTVTAGFTSQSGVETYLSGPIEAPAGSVDTISGSWAYWIGLGTYSVKLAISGGAGGVCRKEWTITVRKWPASGRVWAGIYIPETPPPEFDIRTQIFLSNPKSRPGTADGVVRLPAPQNQPAPPPAQRLTVLMDAPSDPRRQLELLDAFESLLARTPAQPARLVVFTLLEGHEILRRDNFQLSSLGELRAALAGSAGYHAVNVAELQAHPIQTPAALLDAVVQRETHEIPPTDAIVFLGMGRGTAIGSSFRLSAELPHSLPPFSYIQLARAPDPPAVLHIARGGMLMPEGPLRFTNLIPWLVKKQNGKSILVDREADFDRAVKEVRKALGSR